MFRDKRWTTAGAPSGKEAEFWQSIVCDAIFEMDVKISGDDRLQASFRQQRIGPLGLGRVIMNAEQRIVRTRQAIARSSEAQYEFVVVESGHVRVEQRGRDVVLKPGDSVLVYNGETFRLQTEPYCKTVSYHVPASWLELWLPKPEMAAAKLIDGNTPWGCLLSALTNTWPQDGPTEFARGSLFADQLGGALALAFEAGRGEQRGGSLGTFERCLEHLQATASDCELSAQDVADALHISLRYLHKLFAAHGTSYSAELLGIRLRLAARLLRHPQFGDLPVAEIAWRAGFTDPSHFYRRFRERFSMPPGAYRSNPIDRAECTYGHKRYTLS